MSAVSQINQNRILNSSVLYLSQIIGYHLNWFTYFLVNPQGYPSLYLFFI